MPDLLDGACVYHDPELFFGPHICSDQCDAERGCYIAKAEQGRFRRISDAKTVCRACPVLEDCLMWALETKQPYGVWGCSTERDRRVMLRQIANGIPAEDVVAASVKRVKEKV